MKFSPAVIISFFTAATILLPTLAAPAPAAESDLDVFEREDTYEHLETRGRRRIQTPAEKAEAWLRNPKNIGYLTGNICFWSGRTLNHKAAEKVADFGQDPNIGCRSIYDLLATAGINAKGLDGDNYGWYRVSVALAENMHGTAKALLGQAKPDKAIWNAELKALRANKNVVAIEHWELTGPGSWDLKQNETK